MHFFHQNGEPKPSTQGGEALKDMAADDGDDVSMAGEEGEANKNKVKTATGRQNEKLYAVESILNTKMKRAESKPWLDHGFLSLQMNSMLAILFLWIPYCWIVKFMSW